MIAHILQIFEEFGTCVHTHHIETKPLVGIHHLLELILAQHTVINEDTREVFADGPVKQCGTNRGVDAARKAEDDAVVADLLAELIDRGLDKRGSAPLLTAVTDVNDKIPQ